MIVLRELIYTRNDLRLILMSATMNAEIFKDYFGRCPLLEISGRAFPVQEYFLEDTIDQCGYSLEINNEYAKKNKVEVSCYQCCYILT